MGERERGCRGEDVAGEAEVAASGSVEEEMELDLEVERIDTEGVLKEGFAGQEM